MLYDFYAVTLCDVVKYLNSCSYLPFLSGKELIFLLMFYNFNVVTFYDVIKYLNNSTCYPCLCEKEMKHIHMHVMYFSYTF